MGCRAGGKHRAARLLSLAACTPGCRQTVPAASPSPSAGTSAPLHRSRGRFGLGGTGAPARTFQVALVEARGGGAGGAAPGAQRPGAPLPSPAGAGAAPAPQPLPPAVAPRGGPGLREAGPGGAAAGAPCGAAAPAARGMAGALLSPSGRRCPGPGPSPSPSPGPAR